MPALQLIDVTRVFGTGRSAVTALADVNLTIEAGEFAALVGPPGSGKSTLLAIAGALIGPTYGRVLLEGTDLSRLTEAQLARLRLGRIGFVLRSSSVIPYLNARDQLLLVSEMIGQPGSGARKRADQLLRQLGLADRAEHFPEAMSSPERQLVTVARSLMNSPAILLADDPTGGLDDRRAREVADLIARETSTRGIATLMVTQDQRLLDRCDRVVRVQGGRIADDEVGGRRDEQILVEATVRESE